MGYSEKNINTMVKNSLAVTGGFCFKIADPQKGAAMSSQKNPFDGFGVISPKVIAGAKTFLDVYPGKYDADYVPLYWESKFKSTFEAFSLTLVEEHQGYYLDWVSKLPNSLTLLPLGVYMGRGDIRVYLFDWNAVSPLYHKRFSIHKAYLEKLPYNQVTLKTGLFEAANIITKGDLDAIYGVDVHSEDFNAKR